MGNRAALIAITKSAVDAVTPGEVDRVIWDRDLKGFGLKVTPAGKKVYLFQYRLGGRGFKVRRYTIGPHGSPWTAHTARIEAQRLRGEVAKQVDPGTTRQAQGAAIREAERAATLNAFADRYLKEYAEPRKKPRTVDEDRRNLTLHIRRALGAKKMVDITHTDIVRFHLSRRAKPVNANRCLALLSNMFTIAMRWGVRPDGVNPCKHVEPFPESKRTRFLSAAEVAALGKALADAEQTGVTSASVVAAIRLLMLTGCRKSEILTLRWDEVDIERALLQLRDSKTGQKVVYLNAPALQVLSELTPVDGHPFVIPGEIEGEHANNIDHAWRKIRASAGLADVRLHDLRHSFASVAAGAGMSLPVIGALLGHRDAATTQRYAHLAADPLKQANDLIGARLMAAMRGGGDGQVVPIAQSPRSRTS